MAQRVFIASPGHHGHRLVYVSLIANGLATAGEEVVVGLTDQGLASREAHLHLNALDASVQLTTIPPHRLSWRAIRRIASDNGCDRVVLPDGDRWSMRLGVGRPWPCRPPTHVLVTQDPDWSTRRDVPSRIKMWIKKHLISYSSARTGLSIVQLVSQGMTSSRSRLTVRDPVIASPSGIPVSELRRQFGLQLSRHWFVVAGYINHRKNAPRVLDSIIELDGKPRGLFLVGEIAEPDLRAIEQLLPAAERRDVAVVIRNRVLSNEEINLAIEAADTVVIAYTSDSPNSMMTKGLRLGRTVVVSGSNSLQHWGTQVGVTLVGPSDRESLDHLLMRALESEPPEPNDALGGADFWQAFR